MDKATTAKFKKVTCFKCLGYGQVAAYSLGDFDGARECETCNGSGVVYKTPKGRYVKWIGGPFC